VTKFAFDAHKFEKKNFKPLGRHIIVSDMHFDERISNGGIIILDDNKKSHGIRPRWAQVYALGPEFIDDDIKVGSWICISHGRWTRGIDIEDETGKHTLRRVDENDILLISDEPVNDLTMGDSI
jgi:co-chaperonin GroES (HSP10)